MSESKKNLSSLLVAFFMLGNAIVVQEGAVGANSWYWVLTASFPLLAIAIFYTKRSRASRH